MKPIRSLDLCNAFIEAQNIRHQVESPPVLPVVTLSRASGAHGITISELLREYLQMNEPDPEPQWTVFDKTLIEQVAADHDLPARMAQFMPEDRMPMVSSAIEELLGLHPSPYDQVRQTAETIRRLGHMGRVILVGRGSQMLLAEMPQALHIRITGSKNKRAQHLGEFYHLKPAAALEMLEREDAAQKRYLRAHFHCDIDDPMLYHMVVNTDKFTPTDAATMIGDAVFRLTQRLEAATHFAEEAPQEPDPLVEAENYQPVPHDGETATLDSETLAESDVPAPGEKLIE